MIQVRKGSYRGKQGWKVVGRPPGVEKGHWGVKIFCEGEAEARRIASDLKQGLPAVFDIFLPEGTSESHPGSP